MIEQLQNARALVEQLAAHLVLIREGAGPVEVPAELRQLAGAMNRTCERVDAELAAALAGVHVTGALAEQLTRHLGVVGALARMAAERCAPQPPYTPPAAGAVQPDGYAMHVG